MKLPQKVWHHVFSEAQCIYSSAYFLFWNSKSRALWSIDVIACVQPLCILSFRSFTCCCCCRAELSYMKLSVVVNKMFSLLLMMSYSNVIAVKVNHFSNFNAKYREPLCGIYFLNKLFYFLHMDIDGLSHYIYYNLWEKELIVLCSQVISTEV